VGGAPGPWAALITEEPVSAQSVSRLTRNVDQAVAQFHQARLADDGRDLFREGGGRATAPRGRDAYPQRVTRLCRDLPEWRACFPCPRALGRTLRTTHVLARCFVEVRRRPRPMVGVVTVQRVERMSFAIVNRVNWAWRPRTLRQCTHVA